VRKHGYCPFPFSENTVEAQQKGELQVLGIGEEQTTEVLDAISSETARVILSQVYADPSTPIVTAEDIDESRRAT
jgi:hypothetical protein